VEESREGMHDFHLWELEIELAQSAASACKT
jgi:hypothetical protein